MDLARRLDELEAQTEAVIGPAERFFARLICDGCGAVERVDPEHPVYPEGWINRGPGDDRCATCATSR